MEQNLHNLQTIIVEFGTPEYDETVYLRTQILRIPLGLEFTEEQLAAEYSDHHLAVLAADQSIIACLILTPLENDDVKMRQVAVSSDLQGKGVGKKLVHFSEEFSKYKGFKKIVLNARDTAIPFYTSLGYNLEGEEFFEVGIPHRHMTKVLV